MRTWAVEFAEMWQGLAFATHITFHSDMAKMILYGTWDVMNMARRILDTVPIPMCHLGLNQQFA
jgi:hypothetical protein